MPESTLLISIISMAGLGMTFATCLIVASKKFKVEEDPRLEPVMDLLPMTNCAACGEPGCQPFAEKLLAGTVEVNGCISGGQDVTDALADYLGVESLVSDSPIAVVMCQGGDKEAKRGPKYVGEKTCASAARSGSEKSCSYACIGYGDCVDSCNYSAMAMSSNNLPVIFYDKCVGCNDCAKTCPVDIIEMHPRSHTLFVYCKNQDKGGPAKKACDVACIGCGQCVKDCSVEEGIFMDQNLAVINYDLAPQTDETVEGCPTNCILNGVNETVTSESFAASEAAIASGKDDKEGGELKEAG